ncbi:GNAT family N-acetyltransferase [Flavobacterium facile]|uniref:GNAT family N-acetyltransferase n=1 Tax=Flavobacterium facile TaxID=2893174 RepID=UPI002E789C5A|nr:GNAT family N-acetyltransferase [Flavobacterium sp. T-12]
MHLQPILTNEIVQIVPLKESDFDDLFTIASDKLLWEQHPEKERYKKEVFQAFFKTAIASKSAFKFVDVKTGNTIGTSRYYEFKETESSVAIGYTFISRKYWATPYNRALKNLMINYAFQFVEKIIFHVGDTNFRSQKAVEKLGALHTETFLNEENGRTHITYTITKENWKS